MKKVISVHKMNRIIKKKSVTVHDYLSKILLAYEHNGIFSQKFQYYKNSIYADFGPTVLKKPLAKALRQSNRIISQSLLPSYEQKILGNRLEPLTVKQEYRVDKQRRQFKRDLAVIKNYTTAPVLQVSPMLIRKGHNYYLIDDVQNKE